MTTLEHVGAEFVDLVPEEVRRRWAENGCYANADLYTLFAQHVAKTPEREAVIDNEGVVSYAELDVLARQIAVGLSGYGISAGDVVGVQIPDGSLSCAIDLALATLGAVALPYPIGRGEREIASLLGRSSAVAAITVNHYGDFPCATTARELSEQIPSLRHVFTVDAEVPTGCARLPYGDADSFVAASPDPDGPVRILVSSGSEAEPKMVLYSHNALAGGRGTFIARMTETAAVPRNLFLVPLASAFGSNGTAATLAACGGTVLPRRRFDVSETLRMIERYRPTHVLAVPTMVRKLLESPELADTDVSSVHAFALGGSPLDVETVEQVQNSLRCAVINVYGSADGVNCHTDPHDAEEPSGSVGKPNPAVTEVRIVDSELRELHHGAIGEILARGPMTPMCYVGAPELAQRYRTEDGWVRTGDLGTVDENGYLSVLGRSKEVIIRGGLNISPAEVETLLITHPSINDVACVPVSDAMLGEHVCACVATSYEVTLSDLAEHLRTAGLDPRKFPEQLVVLTSLPLSAAGKVDKSALQELAEASER